MLDLNLLSSSWQLKANFHPIESGASQLRAMLSKMR